MRNNTPLFQNQNQKLYPKTPLGSRSAHPPLCEDGGPSYLSCRRKLSNIRLRSFSIFSLLLMLISLFTISIIELPSAYAAVVRSGIDSNSVSYSSGLGAGSTKAFWAVNEPVPSGCAVSSISCSTITQGSCAYSSTDKTIRLESHTVSTGGSLTTQITVDITGTGSCTLSTTGQYVESSDGSQIGATSISSASASLTLSGGSTCNNIADTNTDCVINNSELLSYISQWVNNQVNNQALLGAIGFWVAGGY